MALKTSFNYQPPKRSKTNRNAAFTDELALQIWIDEKIIQLMTLTFEVKRAEREVKRAERRYGAHLRMIENSHYGKRRAL